MNLHESYRPATWDDVVGQDKAIAKIKQLRPRGLAGRAWWISGQSGTGKTTLARLLAAEVADPFTTLEVDGGDVTADFLDRVQRQARFRPIGKGAWAYIVNESHGLRAPIIRRLLGILDPVPDHVIWIFTTTCDGQQKLFDDQIDCHPLLSRCVPLPLARRDIGKVFAQRAQDIARAEGLNGRPIGD